MRHDSILISLLVVVAAFGAVSAIAETGSREAQRTNEEQVCHDYSALLALMPDASELRMPTAAEIEKLGPLWPNVPSETNAAYYYAKANGDLIERCERSHPEPPGSLSSAKPYAGDASGIADFIRNNRNILASLQESLATRTFQAPVFIAKQTGMPSAPLALLADVRNMARFLCDAGFAAELAGDPTVAANRYLDCIRMSRQLRGRALLITHFVGASVQTTGGKGLDALLANTSLPSESLKQVIATCRSAEVLREEIVRTLRLEATCQREALAKAEDEKTWKGFLNLCMRWQEADPAPPKDFQECRQMMRRLSEALLQLYDRPIPEILREKEQLWGTVPDDIMGYQALANHIENYQNWPTWLGRLNLSLRVTQIRAAIALYRQQHGDEPPLSLAELCPDILPAVPIDPFSGRPIRYVREGTGWKCWSVGFDLKDDGGIGASRTYLGMPVSGDWVGMDCVYYSLAPSNVEMRSNR